MSAPDRRRTRNRLFLLGLRPAVLALLFAGKVGLMTLQQARGEEAYDAGRFVGAAERFAGNDRLNLMEPWLAPFNQGTARYRADDPWAAVELFRRALPDTPPEHECTVRTNLALSAERIGDMAAEQGDRELAVQAWRAGRSTLAEGECLVASDDADEGDRAARRVSGAQAEDARTVDRRLREKLAELRDDPRPEPPEEPEPPEPPEEPDPEDEEQEKDEERLEQRNEQGRERKQEHEDRQEDKLPDQGFEW